MGKQVSYSRERIFTLGQSGTGLPNNMTNKKDITVDGRDNEAIILTANMTDKRLMDLKIPDNLVQVANINGKLKLVEFWYSVKSIKIDGALCADDYPKISKIIGIAEKTNYKNLLKLHKEGLAMKQGEYFQLCSYNRLWEYLGYDVSEGGAGLSYKSHWMGIKRIKTSVLECSVSLRDYLSLQALKLNIELQERAVIKKVKKELLDTVKNARVAKRMIKSFDLKKHSYIRKFFLEIDFDCTLSLQGIANVLGLKSIKNAYDLIQRLVKGKVLKYKRRVIKANCFNSS